MAKKSSDDQNGAVTVRWSDVTRFIRQLSHDLRNNLNAIELQSTYIAELETNEEIKTDIKRLREMVADLARTLQGLSRAVAEVRLTTIPYRALDLVQDLRSKIERDFAKQSTEIVWETQLAEEMLDVDPQFLEEAFSELFSNAFRHDRAEGPLVATARNENDHFVFTLHEPKTRFDSATQNWGREPLRRTSHRHYGLGLNRVRSIMEAHGGELHAKYDANGPALITTLSVPLAASSRDI